MRTEELLELMKSRYTTKHYSGEKIPREKLEALLEVLRLSPSSVNSQPWHFFVASSDEAKAKILPAILDFNRERVTLASDVVVFAVREEIGPEHLKALLEQELADGRYAGLPAGTDYDAGRRHFVDLHQKERRDGLAWETAQAYIAQGFLLMAAAAIGVDSTPIEGADFEMLDRILGLREKGLRSVVAVSLGVRRPNDSNASRPKSRLPREAVVTEIR